MEFEIAPENLAANNSGQSGATTKLNHFQVFEKRPLALAKTKHTFRQTRQRGTQRKEHRPALFLPRQVLPEEQQKAMCTGRNL